MRAGRDGENNLSSCSKTHNSKKALGSHSAAQSNTELTFTLFRYSLQCTCLSKKHVEHKKLKDWDRNTKHTVKRWPCASPSGSWHSSRWRWRCHEEHWGHRRRQQWAVMDGEGRGVPVSMSTPSGGAEWWHLSAKPCRKTRYYWGADQTDKNSSHHLSTVLDCCFHW